MYSTSHTLKIDVFELPGNKNIEKLFSKYELFFPNQANFSSDLSHILMLQHPVLISSLSPSSLLFNFVLKNWILNSTILIMLSLGFLISPYPIWPLAIDIGYTQISQDKPIKSIIMLSTDHKTKTHNHQKAKYLRAVSNKVGQHG